MIDVVIFSHRDEVSIPTEFFPLTQSTFLSCGIDSPTANYTSRWITPNGEVVIPTGINDTKLTVLEGTVEMDTQLFNGTALILKNLSYHDEGMYICEARDLSVPDSPWMQAVSQLNLLGML